MAYFPIYVSETPQRAREEAEECWTRWRRISAEQRGTPEREPLTYDLAAQTSRAILGDPEMCRLHVRRIIDEVGIDRLALKFHFGGLPQERVLASMRLFAQEVAPCFPSPPPTEARRG